MVDIKLIEEIRQLGFSENEAKCYMMLFRKDSMSASEVAKLGQVPRPNTYNSLERLLEKGLIVSIPGKIKRYSASNPLNLKEKLQSVTDDTINSELKEWEKKKNEIEKRKIKIHNRISSVIDKLEPLYEKSRGKERPHDCIEVMSNSSQIDKRFDELFINSKDEVLIFVIQRPRTWTEESLKNDIEPQIELISRKIAQGLSVKCIYALPPKDEHRKLFFERAIDKYAKAGEQIRLLEELPMRMAIFDEKISMFMLMRMEDNQYPKIAQAIHHPVMARSHKILFESLWEKAIDYYEYKRKENI
jgi:sugar-specific transcriptional regulator TrmB